MSDEEKIEKARSDAHERIDALMMRRRAQIVNGIGRNMAWRVKIEPNGALRVECYDISIVNRTHYLLDAAGIDKGSQWASLPSEVCWACLDKWNDAGRALK